MGTQSARANVGLCVTENARDTMTEQQIKWEYLLIPGLPYISSPVLNGFGDQGWELVAVTADKDGLAHAYFKRPGLVCNHPHDSLFRDDNMKLRCSKCSAFVVRDGYTP